MASAPPARPRVRVFLLDDHEVARRGLADLIGSTHDLVVVGEASSCAEALRAIPALVPDVALLDVRLPDGNGIDVCREIRSDHPGIGCLILTSYDDDRALAAAVVAGAAGYLGKQVHGSALLDALRRVGRGQSLLSQAVTRRLLQTLSAPHDRRGGAFVSSDLTGRERQVLGLIADGLSNRQIAAALDLAEKTVKNYVSAILTKLGLERRTQAAVYGDRLRAGVG
ncbi:MAG: response regulator transcription factor [Friedmanniella sp.]|nr:response regulator transcription factor [Friedmanniella sp.]